MKFAKFVYTFVLCAEKCNHNSKSDFTSPRIIQMYIQNLQTSLGFIFHILQYFATKLHHFTKFRTLFSDVLMNILNSKVCLKGEWSIKNCVSARNYESDYEKYYV